MFLSNLKQQDTLQLIIKDPFLKEIVEHWVNLIYREKNLEFESARIWHNSLIMIENKPFFYKSWFNVGVEKVKDLLDKDCHFISFHDFVKKFKIKTNYLEYYKIVSTLKQYKKICSPIPCSDPKDVTKNLLSHTKICKKVYKHLIEKKPLHRLESIGKGSIEGQLGKYLFINESQPTTFSRK